ncbi:MAG: H-X9-DG-CTERM domain-containing protein, partial [Planctomycetota bacterium]
MFYLIPLVNEEITTSSGAWTSLGLADLPASGPGMPTGIGLLLAGGYLTQKGAEVMSCPSKTVDDEGMVTNMTAMIGSTQADMVPGMYRHDGAEPFYTTGGKLFLANGRMDGSPDGLLNNGGMGRHSYVDGGPAADNAVLPCIDLAGDWFYRGYGHRCSILGSYELRDSTAEHSVHYSSFRLDEALESGWAVASDSVYGFSNLAFAGYFGFGRYGAYTSSYGTTVLTHSTMAWTWTTNHDNAFNVLFADGSVKTFSDAGLSLKKSLALLMLSRLHKGCAWAYHNQTEKVSRVFEPYFDALYAQD